MFKDLVKVADQGLIRLKNRLGKSVLNRLWSDVDNEKSVVEVKGWVQLYEQGSEAPVQGLIQGVGRRLEITHTRQGTFPQSALLVLLGLSGSLQEVTAPDGTPLSRGE